MKWEVWRSQFRGETDQKFLDTQKYQSLPFFHYFHYTNVIFLAYYQKIFIFLVTHCDFWILPFSNPSNQNHGLRNVPKSNIHPNLFFLQRNYHITPRFSYEHGIWLSWIVSIQIWGKVEKIRVFAKISSQIQIFHFCPKFVGSQPT